MVVLDVVLLVLAIFIITILLTLMRRQQKKRYEHLQKLSRAVVALSWFIADRVPGELPQDIRDFTVYFTPIDDDNRVEDR